MSMPTMRIKRGDSFQLTIQGKDANDDAQDMTGWSIASQVRQEDGTLVENLTHAWVEQSEGKYTLTGADTSTWPLEVLRCDIQYTTNAGIVMSTDTILVNMLEDITS